MKQSPLDVAPAIALPLPGNYGAADAGIPVDDVRKREDALKKNIKRYDIKIYLGAKHAFHREGPNCDGEAAKDSRGRTIGGLISAFLPW